MGVTVNSLPSVVLRPMGLCSPRFLLKNLTYIYVDLGTLTDRTELLADDSVYSGRGGNPKNFLSALRKDKWEFQVSTPPIRVASPLVLGALTIISKKHIFIVNCIVCYFNFILAL